MYLLPRDLGRSGLLAGLSPAQLATAMAEAIHAGTPGGARADRAVDVRVLQQLGTALAAAASRPPGWPPPPTPRSATPGRPACSHSGKPT